MLLYVSAFGDEPEYLENSGLFLIICLPLWSVFKVAFGNRKKSAPLTPLTAFQNRIMLFALVAFICGVSALMSLDATFILLELQAVLWILIVYRIFMTVNAKKSKGACQNNLQVYAFERIEKEEALKKEFSNFLHDDILQDLLSLKNLMGKSGRLEVQELIGQTLENLNIAVREQMQDYHPTLLKSLSLKKNYVNLLSAISQKYQPHDIDVCFDCDDGLFLIMPYDLVIYRMIKELATNAFKHSACSKLWLTLTQTDGQIELTVKDNGEISAATVQSALDNRKGKGLLSIQEQTTLLGGQLSITGNMPTGLRVRVSLPMRGEGSYEYFIGR
jgi:two-component system secretion system sensor histidine kinase SalK